MPQFLTILRYFAALLKKEDEIAFLEANQSKVCKSRVLTKELVKLYFDKEDYASALEAADAYLPNSDQFKELNLDILYYRAESLCRVHRLDESVTAWEELRAIYEDHPVLEVPSKIPLGQGRAFMAIGKFNQGFEFLEEAISIDPDSLAARQTLEYYKNYFRNHW